MSSTVKRPGLLGSRIRLHQQTFLDNLLDVSLFAGKVPLSVADSYSEPSGQEHHKDLISVWR